MSYRNLFLILILISAGFAVYAFNLNNPLFWDDTDWIVNNPFVHSLSLESVKNWFTKNTLAGIGLRSNYYRPFLFFTFASNYVLHGSSPIGYHLVNNLLHITNGILIFWLLSMAFGGSRFIPFFVSFLFLLHPLQTEAITYVAGRGDPLNVFLMLLALLLFYKAEQSNFSWKKPIRFLTLPLLILALLSRETAIMFPFLLIIFYIAFIFPNHPDKSGATGRAKAGFISAFRSSVKKALPYFGVVFIYGILRLTVLNFQNILNFYTQPNTYSESLFVRMLTFLGVLTEYTKLIFAPTGLHMERSVDVFSSFFHLKVLTPFLVILFLVYFLYRLYKKRKFEDFRIFLFSFGWFFVNLAPTSGITPINAVMYEHWLYLALVGPFTLIIFYLNRWREKYSAPSINSGQARKILALLPIFILISSAVWFSFISIQRNILWGKPIAFFEDILKYEPQSARINNNIGNLYYNEGNIAKAEEYYWQAVSADDTFPQPHFNLGSILDDRGDTFGAISEFEKAIRIDPYFHYAYEGLIVIYAREGDLVKATEYSEILKKLYPQNPRIYFNLALIYLARKDFDSAIANLNEGLKYSGSDSQTEEQIKDLLLRLDAQNK